MSIEAVGAGPAVVGAMPEDHRRRPRKRGEELEHAIAEAVVRELGDRGYAGLTFEGVAARACTGKSALYRRWADKPSMVADAIVRLLPDAGSFPLSADLRTDLRAMLREIADSFRGPLGLTMRLVAGEVCHHPDFERVWHERVVIPWTDLIQRIVTSAVERGEARAGAAAPECLFTGPALVCQRYQMTGEPPTHEEIDLIIDNALLPMFTPRG